MNMNNKTKTWDFVIPISLLATATLLFSKFDWDMELQRLFYEGDTGWFLKNTQPWKFLYHNSNIPALLISVSSLILLGISFFKTSITKYRKILIFLTFVMAIGPGLIVNTILKDNWGRPRPRNIEEFGGNYKYEKPLTIDPASKGKSFPCGHASMGFYLMTFFFIFRKKRKLLAYSFLLLGIVSGCLIGMARIVQGGHFASDVVWAGGIVYLVSATAFYLFKMDKSVLLQSEFKLPIKRNLTVLILFLTSIALALLIISATPHLHNKEYIFSSSNDHLDISIQIERGDVRIIDGDSLKVVINAVSHGYPWSKLKSKVKFTENGIAYLSIMQRESGYFSEVNQTITITLPDSLQIQLSVIIDEGNLIISDYLNEFELQTDLKKGLVIR